MKFTQHFLDIYIKLVYNYYIIFINGGLKHEKVFISCFITFDHSTTVGTALVLRLKMNAKYILIDDHKSTKHSHNLRYEFENLNTVR